MSFNPVFFRRRRWSPNVAFQNCKLHKFFQISWEVVSHLLLLVTCLLHNNWQNTQTDFHKQASEVCAANTTEKSTNRAFMSGSIAVSAFRNTEPWTALVESAVINARHAKWPCSQENNITWFVWWSPMKRKKQKKNSLTCGTSPPLATHHFKDKRSRVVVRHLPGNAGDSFPEYIAERLAETSTPIGVEKLGC